MPWNTNLINVRNNTAKGPVLTQQGSSDSTPRPVDSPGHRINHQIAIVFAQANVPVPCTPFSVPRGCKVKARAYNGAANGNSAAVYVAQAPETLLSGNGIALAPLDNVDFPVDNTARLWAKGAIGDGVIFSVVSQE